MFSRIQNSVRGISTDLKNEISKTVHDPLRPYTIASKPRASGGPLSLWKIYDATEKGKGDKFSVFEFDRADLEKRVDKRRAADVFADVKAGAAQLGRLRHPHWLHVVVPVYEHKNKLILVTENVLASVANVFLGEGEHTTGVEGAMDTVTAESLPDVAVQFGLYQVADAVDFAHSVAQLALLGLGPGSVYITRSGDWKVGDCTYCATKAQLSQTPGTWNRNFRETLSNDLMDSRINGCLGPLLNYSAPEYVLDNQPCLQSDLFSLGCLFFSVLKAQSSATFLNAADDVQLYQSQIVENARRTQWAGLDERAQQAVLALTTRDPAARVEISVLVNSSPFFGQIHARCLIFVKTLVEKDPKAKLAFLKDLYSIVDDYPANLVRLHLLDPLLAELKDFRMARFVLPILLKTLANMDTGTFVEKIIPVIAPYMQVGDHVVSQLLLERFDDILAKCNQSLIDATIVPFLARSMAIDADPQTVTLCMNTVKRLTLDGVMTPAHLRSAVLPPLLSVCIQKGFSLEIRRAAVTVIRDMSRALDSDCAERMVEPTLKRVMESETDPDMFAVTMEAYAGISAKFTTNAVARQLLPSLCPIMVNTSLDMSQLQSVVATVKSLVSRVEADRSMQLKPTSVPSPTSRRDGGDGATDGKGAGKGAASGAAWDTSYDENKWKKVEPVKAAALPPHTDTNFFGGNSNGGGGGGGFGGMSTPPPPAAPPVAASSGHHGGYSPPPIPGGSHYDPTPQNGKGGNDSFGDFAFAAAAPTTTTASHPKPPQDDLMDAFGF